MINERDIALSKAYDGIKERLNISVDEFVKAFDEWEIIPAKSNNEIVGCVMIKENEMHISISPLHQKKFNLISLVRKLVKPMIDKYGFIKTSSLKNSINGIKFIEKMGFKKVSENELMYFYEKR